MRQEERREQEVARRLAALQARITAWVLETFPEATVEEREEEVRQMAGFVWGSGHEVEAKSILHIFEACFIVPMKHESYL